MAASRPTPYDTAASTAARGQRVFVYRNLHRNCWSLRAASGPDRGRVIAHVASALLTEATFRVQEAGRQRVLRERKKNVHAGLVGWYAGPTAPLGGTPDEERVRYNPFDGPTFTAVADGRPVTRAARVWAMPDGKVYASGAS